MSLRKLPKKPSRLLLPPLNSCDFSSHRHLSPNLTSNDTLTSINSPHSKNSDFIRFNKRRISELANPSDPFISKFEKISIKLENVINKVHKKYSYENLHLKPSPKGSSIQIDESSLDCHQFEEVQKPVKKHLTKRATLNKHIIRSQIFEKTSKWLSPNSKKQINKAS